MTKAFNTEQEQVDLLVPWLENQGFCIACEVGQSMQMVDVAGAKDGRLYLIEAKLTNWKQAMRQCEAHELVADYIYIAIGSKNISLKFLKAMKEIGYGIIHCHPITGNMYIALKAKKNKHYWIPAKRVFLNKFRYKVKHD